MPRVITYERRVQQEALPGATRQAHETFESSGGTIAQAKGDAGATQANAYGRIAATTLAVGGPILEEQRNAQDQVALLGAERKFGELELKLLHDPDSGALNIKGKDALGLREKVTAEYDKQAADIVGSLSNPRQQAAIQRTLINRRLAIANTVEQHAQAEVENYDKAETAATIDQATMLAAASAGDPRRVAQLVVDGEDTIRAHAVRQGAGPEWVADTTAKFRNELWSGVITNRLSLGQTEAARVYLEEARDHGHLTGDALNRMQEAVKAGVTEAKGESIADTIWTELGPKDDDTPIELDKLEARARELAGDNVDLKKSAIAAIRSRKQAADDARGERLEQRKQTVWGAAATGKSLAAIQRLPEFINAPGKFKVEVQDYFAAEAAREEARKNSEEARAASRENRAWTREQREQAQVHLRGMDAYLILSDPMRLRQLSEGQILELLPSIGNENVDRLLRQRRAIDQDQGALARATMDNDLFKEIAHDVGGIAYANNTPASMGEKQRQALGALKAATEDAIGRRQVDLGRPLTRDETRKEMEAIVKQKVYIDRWFADDQAITATVSASDRPNAYVPIKDVPADAVADAVAFIRGEYPRQTKDLSDEDVKNQYADRIGRAYGRQITGGSNDERRNALRGK